MKYLITLLFFLILTSPALAQLTQEDRDMRIKNIQEERKKIYEDYRLNLENLEKTLSEKLTEVDQNTDPKLKQENRKNVFKEINQIRKDLRSTLNTRAWELTAQEDDLKQGGDGDLDAIKKKATYRRMPPDFAERNKKLTESLTAVEKDPKNEPQPVIESEDTHLPEVPAADQIPFPKEMPAPVPSGSSGGPFDWTTVMDSKEE